MNFESQPDEPDTNGAGGNYDGLLQPYSSAGQNLRKSVVSPRRLPTSSDSDKERSPPEIITLKFRSFKTVAVYYNEKPVPGLDSFIPNSTQELFFERVDNAVLGIAAEMNEAAFDIEKHAHLIVSCSSTNPTSVWNFTNAPETSRYLCVSTGHAKSVEPPAGWADNNFDDTGWDVPRSLESVGIDQIRGVQALATGIPGAQRCSVWHGPIRGLDSDEECNDAVNLFRFKVENIARQLHAEKPLVAAIIYGEPAKTVRLS
jgi:hypothetical protein